MAATVEMTAAMEGMTVVTAAMMEAMAVTVRTRETTPKIRTTSGTKQLIEGDWLNGGLLDVHLARETDEFPGPDQPHDPRGEEPRRGPHDQQPDDTHDAPYFRR